MKSAHRGIAIAALVTVLGVAGLWQATDGLQAFTAEAARRAEILRNPRALPAAVLEDQNGRHFSLRDYQGRLLAVEFIYTRCSTICRTLGLAFKQIHNHVPQQALGDDFALLSISFDIDGDDTSRLKDYGEAYGADGEHWRIARVRSAAELGPLLAAFGIVVIPDQMGGFEHNAAIHLLGRDGRLALISDIDAPVLFAEKVSSWL
ncbi:MAG: SCO family protein [Sulfuritalea sp.]|nr:SCO family protein [Sulfuritalea sp.]